MEESERRWWVEIILDKFNTIADYEKAHEEVKDWLTANAPPGSWESSCVVSLGTGRATIDVYFNEDGLDAAVACKLTWG